ncbi:hypothetical protein ATANTOWER_025401 [Ataeniobius toweri]|uniref:Uncharacterized protein n=1 Tax=Ataeniobius toweri TaxID=208326 RepID=A0ABU7AB79_9TELE|nr:hypothetical protein [Ataeniobius toweri]
MKISSQLCFILLQESQTSPFSFPSIKPSQSENLNEIDPICKVISLGFFSFSVKSLSSCMSLPAAVENIMRTYAAPCSGCKHVSWSSEELCSQLGCKFTKGARRPVTLSY